VQARAEAVKAKAEGVQELEKARRQMQDSLQLLRSVDMEKALEAEMEAVRAAPGCARPAQRQRVFHIRPARLTTGASARLSCCVLDAWRCCAGRARRPKRAPWACSI
jgi:hypothetical protein